MRWYKIGMSNSRKGFTLLELLTVMALIAILSFSVVYSLRSSPQQALNQSQRLVERFLQTARTTAILNNSECRLLVLDDPDSADHERLMILMIKDEAGQWKGRSGAASLPEGIGVSFDKFGEVWLEKGVGDKNELWKFISFNSVGSCRSRLYLKDLKDGAIKVNLTMTVGGGIEID